MTATAPPLHRTAREPVALLSGLLHAEGTRVLDRSWWSWAGPHGGLLSAVALRTASRMAGPGRTPRTLAVQLLRTLEDGEVRPSAEHVREGGSSSVVRCTLRGSDGDPAVLAVLTSGRARSGALPVVRVPAPDVPGPDDCAPLALPVELVPYAQHLEHRPATGALPLSGGDRPELVAWVRLRGDDPLDAAVLTVLADAMPPALYAVATAPVPVPTVELQVSYASGLEEAPQRGWVLVRIATRSAGDGWCVDDSEVWAPDGALLVQARQTRRVLGDLRPPRADAPRAVR